MELLQVIQPELILIAVACALFLVGVINKPMARRLAAVAALLSLVVVVAGANDIILLFLGIELASIPTYIMVSVSRPLPAAQEAGVKYFFLGALAAAVMLFGFSYLYGTTGLTSLSEMATRFAATLPQ